MLPVPLSDPGDERLADYRNVPDAELVQRRGIFVAEGRLVVERLLASDRFVTRSVMMTDTAAAALAASSPRLPAARDAVPAFIVPQATMDRVAGFPVHRGCLAIGERPAPGDWRRLASRARRLVVLEGVGNADNVGAIFRNAAAFDVDAVLLGPSCADPLYRKAIRTSMAATLAVPFAAIGPWPEALEELDRERFSLVALTPAAHGVPLPDVAAETRGRAVALVVGHEGDGLTVGALAACDHLARIPMSRRVDSLNVATALAIGLYALTSEP